MDTNESGVPETHPVLGRLPEVIPIEELKSFRKLDDLHPYLPIQIAGLTISKEQGEHVEALRQRTAVVRFVANTPAMGSIAKRYSPFAIWRLFAERFKKADKTGYSAELQAWEGISDDGKVTETGRGHTNPFNLLAQLVTMGPTGDEYKRGPTPVPWHIHEIAVQKVIDRLHAAGVREIPPAHMVLCTEDSTGDGVPFAMLARKSAAAPAVFDPTRKPQKGKWLKETVQLARRILVKSWRGLLFWPGIVFKRYDRPAPMEVFADTDAALGEVVVQAKDRAIIAQPFANQLAEGTVLRPVQKAIQEAKVPEIDVRTQYHTSLTFQDIVDWVQQPSTTGVRYVIGVDESGWDHHMTPQTWYAIFQITRAMLPETLRIGWVECDKFVQFDRGTQRDLENVAPGNVTQLSVKTRTTLPDGTVEEGTELVLAGMEEIDADSYLRRIYATCSGNDILLGDVRVSGYKTVLDTPTDGKFQCGFGMRSGNWGTFKGNNEGNWYKSEVYVAGVKDPEFRLMFLRMYGYDLPTTLNIGHRLFRGDDAVLAVEVDEAFSKGDVPISQLFTDLIKLTGGKANAKKQETSDLPGVPEFGFSQMYVSELYPTGVSSLARNIERMIYREEDEATGIDPDTGEDYRHLIGDMGNWARALTLYDAFGKTKHPLKEVAVHLWQDLDIPDASGQNRYLPPRDQEERDKLQAIFKSRMLRRGQAPAGSEDLINIWNTDLGPDLEKRFDETPKLAGPWNPISKGKPPEDARPEWRTRIKTK